MSTMTRTLTYWPQPKKKGQQGRAGERGGGGGVQVRMFVCLARVTCSVFYWNHPHVPGLRQSGAEEKGEGGGGREVQDKVTDDGGVHGTRHTNYSVLERARGALNDKPKIRRYLFAHASVCLRQ